MKGSAGNFLGGGVGHSHNNRFSVARVENRKRTSIENRQQSQKNINITKLSTIKSQKQIE